MRILLSTLIVSRAAHGGPVTALRQARALARRGVEVCIVAPEVDPNLALAPIWIEGYEPSSPSQRFASYRRDEGATHALKRIIDRFKPDVVYDLQGPVWGIDAAVESAIPVVSLIGDYNWFCRRSFLVDSRLKRCSGPESISKCFGCVNREAPVKRQVVQAVLREAERAGLQWVNRVPRLAPYRLWSALEESHAYVRQLRESVDRFVVGDRKARTFLLEQGIPTYKLASVPQGLPEEALVVRRPTQGLGRPLVDRPLRIGFVGRPHLDKGIQVLAQAFDGLPESAPLELWIVHADMATPEHVEPVFRDAARFRTQLASGHIKLLRPESNDALYRLMASVDVGVIPSLQFETPSLAMLEFVAQRTPIVRSESAGMEHVIQDGVNGRTFPYGDSNALRNVLLEIMEDPGLLDRWRARLPAISRDSEYAAKLIEVFASLVSKPATFVPKGRVLA